MADVAEVLQAIQDPTRRRLLELLRPQEQSVRQLTDAIDVSQSAVSQHLKVLRSAGLVAVRPEGTRRLYSVDTSGLASVRAWVDSFWDDALEAFVQHASRTDAAPAEHRPSESDADPTGAQ